MKINRRGFILKFFLGGLGLMGLVSLDSFWFEKYIINWTQYDISVSERNKIKTLQISDLHLYEIKWMHQSLANRINREQPQVLLITGDSINYNSELPLLDRFLNLIDPSIDKVAILGNVEYSGNVDLHRLRKIYEKHNGRLLINENYVFGTKGRKLNILGIDDLYGGNADYYAAAQNIDKTLDTIVLIHRPFYREEIDRINKNLGVNLKLVLSGHTHGGQITFFGKAFIKPEGSGRYLKGWYENDQTRMYVSKGIGTSVLPIRFGARAEASIFYV